MRSFERKSGLARLPKKSKSIKPNYHINAIIAAKTREDNALNRTVSNDTLIRQAVHSIIINMINEGKSKEEILEELMRRFPDFPGNIHFEQRIEDQLKKRLRKRNEIDVEQER